MGWADHNLLTFMVAPGKASFICIASLNKKKKKKEAIRSDLHKDITDVKKRYKSNTREIQKGPV